MGNDDGASGWPDTYLVIDNVRPGLEALRMSPLAQDFDQSLKKN